MTERHLKSDPPTPAERSAVEADVRRELGRVRESIDLTRARSVVGLAGTVTALSAMQLGLTSYDATRTHHSRVTAEQIATLTERLARATIAERRQLLAEPARAEIVVGGALVLSTTLRELGLPDLLVSEHDILDGLVASLA
jgi:exopolyphosphatase/guanosine-5'-triphosphate,3'-diphosphate pyrophosphatase